MTRLKLHLTNRDVALITECEGVFVVEPMRWLWPSEAKAIARRKAKAAA